MWDKQELLVRGKKEHQRPILLFGIWGKRLQSSTVWFNRDFFAPPVEGTERFSHKELFLFSLFMAKYS